jgi:glycosyltransferase involved in cell wall biosynthesis
MSMNLNRSSIDIVVPCYNYGRYLRSCVRSILDQSGVVLRVLIIDDASSDETADVGRALAKEDSRVTFWSHSVNQYL